MQAEGVGGDRLDDVAVADPTYVASGPRWAFHSRIAASARDCTSRNASPFGRRRRRLPGTTFQRGSFTSCFSSRPVQSP